MTEPVITPWEDPAWQAEAQAWIEAQLRQAGLHCSAAITQPHIRPWSTVMRVPTDGGVYFFKALPPHLKAEVSFTRALAAWQPDFLPTVLAAVPERGWVLLADAGERLRQRIKAAGPAGHWQQILPIYARVQQATAARAATLLSLGLPDRRLERLPQLYARLLTETNILRLDQEDGLTTSEYEQLLARQDRLEELAEQLAAFNLPPTIDHGDLHDGNIFIRGDDYQLMDWGDASLSHPFFSLLVAQRSTANTLGVELDDPIITGMVDIYLAAWRDYADPAALRAAFDLAQPLAMFVRALIWRNALGDNFWPGGMMTTTAAGVAGWLQEFLLTITTA